MRARIVMEKYTRGSAADPDSSSEELRKSGLAAKMAVVRWNRPARPAAAEPSVAQNRRVKVDHGRNELSVRLRAGSIPSPGKIPGDFPVAWENPWGLISFPSKPVRMIASTAN